VSQDGFGTTGPILPGRRPGDQRVRVGRERPQQFELPSRRRVRRPPTPAVVLVRGFLLMIAVGTGFLVLPISSASGRWTPVVDALFTATSAVCVTGLVVVDTGTYWSPLGQAAILVLIQLGGLGFMTAATLLLFVLVRRRTALRDRVLVQASGGATDLASATVVLRRVALFTMLVEAIGILVLLAAFLGRGIDPVTSLWWGVFHGISAFNNAGFDVTGGFRSFTPFADDAFVLGVIASLFVLGGLGFAIVGDIAYKRRWSRLALETKLVVLTTLALLVSGTVIIGLFEWSNPATLGGLEPVERVWNAAFTSATARTAGFNSIDTGALVVPSLAVLGALMFIGGASGSTAGGIKVNTFSLLLISIISTIRGDQSATALGRRVPDEVVYRALSVALLAIALVFLVSLGLALSLETRFIELVFEAVSAFGTVGLSTGITPDLPDPARLLVTLAMFAGRLGPLTLVLALAARVRPRPARPAIESIRIG
jgi:trk system potassium uptake protein